MIINKTYIFLTYVLYIFLVLILWLLGFFYENTIKVLFCFSVFYSFSAFLIHKYNKGDHYKLRLKWIVLFSAKVLLSLLVLKVFWLLPLEKNGFLRTDYQDSLTTDSNFYDYIGLEIAKNGISQSFGLLFSTWLSFGIVFYIYFIYSFIGENILFITLSNVLLTLGSLIFIRLSVFKNYNDNRNENIINYIPFVLLIPYVSYYDSVPSKEPLCYFGLSYLIYSTTSILNSSKTSIYSRNLYNLLFSIIILTIVRPNFGILTLFPTFYLLRKRLKPFVITYITILVGLIVYFAVDFVIGVNSFVDSYTYLTNSAEINDGVQASIQKTSSDGGIKNLIANTFAPSGMFQTILFTPFRIVIWLVLPFPFIIPNVLIFRGHADIFGTDWNLFFRFVEQSMRMLSSMFIVLLFPLFIRACINFVKLRQKFANSIDRTLLIFFFSIIIPLTITNFIDGGRYRVLVEPLYFLICICQYKNFNIVRDYSVYYVLLFFIIVFSNVLIYV
jgi:hypothetical protein